MRRSLLAADELLHIKLPDTSAKPVSASRVALRTFCSAVRDLPPTTEELDFSTIAIDGQPIRRELVVVWINAAYKLSFMRPFEQQAPGGSLTDLAHLLKFAEAVGSSRDLMQELFSDVAERTAQVNLPNSRFLVSMQRVYVWVKLPIAGGTHWWLCSRAISDFSDARTVVGGLTDDNKMSVRQQVASQLSEVWQKAHKLQLGCSNEHVADFVCFNTATEDCLLHGSWSPCIAQLLAARAKRKLGDNIKVFTAQYFVQEHGGMGGQ